MYSLSLEVLNSHSGPVKDHWLGSGGQVGETSADGAEVATNNAAAANITRMSITAASLSASRGPRGGSVSYEYSCI